MSLSPGTRLGSYEIIAPIGAGGMGEVYLAEDTNLHRKVALKFLPEGAASDPVALERFRREAQAAAALNHPGIVTVYETGIHDRRPFISMAHVDGQPLSRVIASQTISISAALRIAMEACEVLVKAHASGIIHRDLKPDNIMIDREGHTRILDFGLAKLRDLPGLTEEHTTLGTLHYMSPEQVRGDPVDHRSDLFSVGVVLYEMIAGHPPFTGSHPAAIQYAIANEPADPVSRWNPRVTPDVERLVGRLLEKDPDKRPASAEVVVAEIRRLLAEADRRKPIVGRRWVRSALLVIASAAAAALVVTLWPRGHAGPSSMQVPQRYSVGRAKLESRSAPMLSPGGTFIVFSMGDRVTRRLYRRELSSFQVSPIEGTDDGVAPFFSPDGRWIGFATSDALKKVPIGGGVAQQIVAVPNVNSADWGDDGTIYFSLFHGGRDRTTALARVADTGGRVEAVARLDTVSGEVEGWLPEILPDGKTVLLGVARAGSLGLVAIRPDGSRLTVLEHAFLGRYVSGYLLYYDFISNAVLAAPFDSATLRTTGPAIPLTEEADFNYGFDVGRHGKLVYVPVPGAGMGNPIVWLDRRGATSTALDVLAPWTQPRVSPDGRRILLRKLAFNCELWMLDVERGTLARVAPGNDDHDPVWSPDGRRFAFRRNDVPEMVTLTVEGPREIQVLGRGSDAGIPQSWSEGGDLLVYTLAGRTTESDIWVRAMGSSSPAVAWLATQYNETRPSISPDGRWIAYDSDETGSHDVFVRPYPEASPVWQVSLGGGHDPVWSRDARRLYFVSGNKMMTAPVETQPVFRVGAPRVLFDGGFSTSSRRDFDVTTDGRFVAVGIPKGDGDQQEIRVLLNWPEVMRQTGGMRSDTHG